MSLTPSGFGGRIAGRSRIRVALIAVMLAVAVGATIFHLLEGWSILDSLYVTVQTVTTVGFGDLTPHTVYGRAFATIFMLAGVGVVLYALTSTVQSIVQSEMVATFGQRRLSRKMNKLRPWMRTESGSAWPSRLSMTSSIYEGMRVRWERSRA